MTLTPSIEERLRVAKEHELHELHELREACAELIIALTRCLMDTKSRAGMVEKIADVPALREELKRIDDWLGSIQLKDQAREWIDATDNLSPKPCESEASKSAV